MSTTVPLEFHPTIVFCNNIVRYALLYPIGHGTQRVGWTVTGPSLAGRLHSLGFWLWVSSRKSHTTRRRGHLRVVISTVSDPSGSGRVDMLTGPVAAARAFVATGAWVESKHMYLIRGSVGA